MNPINAKFMREHFTLVHVTDKPAPQAHPLDPQDLREILAALVSGAARLRGQRCEFSDKRQAHDLDHAAHIVREALEGLDK